MRETRWLPYILLLPATAFLIAFFLLPFLEVALNAFTPKGGGAYSLSHFRTMIGDWKFGPAVRNTFVLTLIIVPLQTILALALASLVMKVQRRADVLLYILTIPLGISDLAAGLIWLAIFEQTGYLNTFLYSLGIIPGPQTLLSYQNTWVLFAAVILAEVWRATAIMLVILVAGMGLIPKEYYEAAEVFGAGAWRRFVRITLPLLRPSLQTALILRTILAFEVFGIVAALAGTNLQILMGETYAWQFDFQDNGVASAYALLILAISIGFTLILLWALRDRTGARA